MTHTHTPGEWEILRADRSEYNESIAKDMAGCLANGEKVLAYFPTASAMANARLISAAPDLLAALEGLLSDNYLADPINADRMAEARAAVAKATGKGQA
jgi:hypothetical protein